MQSVMEYVDGVAVVNGVDGVAVVQQDARSCTPGILILGGRGRMTLLMVNVMGDAYTYCSDADNVSWC